MNLGAATAHAVRCLLELLDGPAAARVGERLRLDLAEPVERRGGWRAVQQHRGSVLHWLLESDQPEVNRQLLRSGYLPRGLQRDVLAGVRFGPGAGPGAGADGPLPVLDGGIRPEHPEEPLPDLLAALYGAGKLSRARTVVAGLRRAHWPELAQADRLRPLPGYVRWALVERFDCPDELRQSFGDNPRYRHRLREAGIRTDPRQLLWTGAPARDLVPLLELGRWGFPERLAPAERELRELVRAEVGGNPEAWAVLAQLLPDFVGTLPQLISTAGAIAGGPGGG
ncbi:hypothetical protein [Kitasatospora sp. LaBMicrA B282]|uniref:hypothetical protein n=1 Tax=Kitasatospora sp. LaBMicrA B282 TaxID=3420949 RepID=UPI003D0FA6E7